MWSKLSVRFIFPFSVRIKMRDCRHWFRGLKFPPVFQKRFCSFRAFSFRVTALFFHSYCHIPDLYVDSQFRHKKRNLHLTVQLLFNLFGINLTPLRCLSDYLFDLPTQIQFVKSNAPASLVIKWRNPEFRSFQNKPVIFSSNRNGYTSQCFVSVLRMKSHSLCAMQYGLIVSRPVPNSSNKRYDSSG